MVNQVDINYSPDEAITVSEWVNANELLDMLNGPSIWKLLWYPETLDELKKNIDELKSDGYITSQQSQWILDFYAPEWVYQQQKFIAYPFNSVFNNASLDDTIENQLDERKNRIRTAVKIKTLAELPDSEIDILIDLHKQYAWEWDNSQAVFTYGSQKWGALLKGIVDKTSLDIDTAKHLADSGLLWFFDRVHNRPKYMRLIGAWWWLSMFWWLLSLDQWKKVLQSKVLDEAQKYEAKVSWSLETLDETLLPTAKKILNLSENLRLSSWKLTSWDVNAIQANLENAGAQLKEIIPLFSADMLQTYDAIQTAVLILSALTCVLILLAWIFATSTNGSNPENQMSQRRIEKKIASFSLICGTLLAAWWRIYGQSLYNEEEVLRGLQDWIETLQDELWSLEDLSTDDETLHM